jgi:hypothetical protein
MPQAPSRLSSLAALLAFAAGCGGKSSSSDTAAPCEPGLPLTAAGPDLVVTLGEPAALDATASRFCARYVGTAVYEWDFASVPTASAVDVTALSDNRTATASTPFFTPDVPGDYVLELVVSDESGEGAPDYVVVTVGVGDAAPVADCGLDLTGEAGDALSFDGSASSDPEGAVLTWSWALTGTPACSAQGTADLLNAGGATPSLVPDCDGIYTVSLVVSDGVNFSEPDICYANVSSNNQLPIADAGISEEFGVCAENPFELNAWGSYDNDGDTLTYAWTVVRVPAGSAVTEANFDDPSSPTPKLTWDVDGTYLFQLQVHDGTQWSAPDLVQLTVDTSATNDAPVANAGEDVVIEAEVDCESSSYVWTCPDCAAEEIELSAAASFDPDGDRLSYTWAENTGSVYFHNRYASVTDATIPAQPATYRTGNTTSYDIQLEVADCGQSASDTMTVTYTCTGQKP